MLLIVCMYNLKGLTHLVYMGICVPSSCSEEDVNAGLAELAHANSHKPDRIYTPKIFSCETQSDKIDYDWKDALFL